MIKKSGLIIIIMGIGIFSMAQTRIENLSKEIVSNNLSIKAMSLENQMKILEDKGELIPDDPEIVGAYLWGSPSYIGDRTNLDASQKIKFPTYYTRLKDMNNLSADMYASQLELEVNRILFESLDLLLDMTHAIQRKALLAERLELLKQVNDLAMHKFNIGETNRIEVEKASLMVDTYRQDSLIIESEIKILHNRLVALNADKQIILPSLTFNDFAFFIVFPDTSNALVNNPAVNIAEMNSQLAEADIRLAKTGYLPDLQMGYTSEAINGEKLAGVELGISIPLWGKPNQVKRAELRKEWSDQRLALSNLMIQNDWDNLDEMAQQSLVIKDNLEESLESMKTIELLEKSWQLGEMSLLDYLKELPFYYGVEDRVVEAEKQYYKALLNRDKYHLQEKILN